MENSPLHRFGVHSRPPGGINEPLHSYAPDIVERTLQFGLRSIRMYRHLLKQKDSVAKVLAGQFLRAAMSIGANVEEAQAAESRTDVVHKLRIAQKEARESRYWIRLLREAEILEKEKSDALYRESDELLRILSKIIVNTRANSSGKDQG